MDHVPTPPIVSHLVEVLKDPRRAKNLVAACLQNYPADFVPHTDIQILICVAGFLAGGKLKDHCSELLVRYATAGRGEVKRIVEVYAALETLQIKSGDPRQHELITLLWPEFGQAVHKLVKPLITQTLRDLEALARNGIQIVTS